MNKIDSQYIELLQDIMNNGTMKEDRTGTGTLSVFGRQIKHKMSDGFPLLTTKKVHFKSVVTELLWFLRGETNIKYLVENDCNIWNGDAYKKYVQSCNLTPEKVWDEPVKGVVLEKEEFTEKVKTDNEFSEIWGELGPIYGSQWRHWGGELCHKYKKGIDQIQNIINDLKNNPDSRRIMVNAWNVAEIDKMALPPCHYGFQFYTRVLSRKERWDWLRRNCKSTIPWDRMATPPNEWLDEVETIDAYDKDLVLHKSETIKVPKRGVSLLWNQRSVDTFLGLPFNIASYGLLLEIIAKEVNMIPDELIGNLGDTHLYLNHVNAASEQIKRSGFELPEVRLRNYDNLDELINTKDSINMIQLWRYDSHPTIKAKLSN